MNPYQLMIELRNNRILFQYLEEVSISFKEDEQDWTIKGKSSEGTAYIQNTSSDVLRVILPIPVPKEIPTEAVYKIVMSTQSKFEGILGVVDEGDDTFIEYYIHGLLDEGLDAALIKFTQERRELKKGFATLLEDIKDMMAGMQAMMGGMMGGRVPASAPKSPDYGVPPKSESEDIWSTMADIEKNISDEPLPGVDKPEPENKEEEDNSEEN